MLVATFIGIAAAHAMPELVERAGLVPRGEGRLSLGAGTYFRDGGNLTLGQLELRYGLFDRVELRLLLPGIAFEVVREGKNLPGLIAFLGMSELGFNSIHGSTVGYQVGLRITKQLLPRLRLSATVELRQRLLGQENAELAVVGPLPPSRAGLFSGDGVVQLHRALAVTGSFGYALSIFGGRSFGYGSVGVVGSFARRLDLFAQLILERSRLDRIFSPAFFGGLTMAF